MVMTLGDHVDKQERPNFEAAAVAAAGSAASAATNATAAT